MGYGWYGEFELLSIVTVRNKYIVLTTKVYVELTEPTSYNTHINQGTSEYQRENKSEDHKVLSEEWYTYFDAKDVIRENIQYALDILY